ncbi:hypothetical protein EGW08_021637, partial [Elysia chlorotica]
IEQSLQDVDLVSQADTFASNLSGGQKRKLSVAIALIGDPKLIFLDEPTAGMDPFSRRRLWTLLKKRKEGRVILLTTHFMDEADILSDRKAFMSKGKLRCCGSSLFLKNKFGVGYHLTMVAAPSCNVQRVTSSLQGIIPSIKLERSHGKEISYTVPLSDVDKFSTLFEMLDEQANTMGLKSYGVSMTTLEEVFLKLDWNGHVGSVGTGYREVHGGMGYGRLEPDVEGERILEYALAHDLLLGNTCFKKSDSHLATYKSGNAATQIDFILYRRNMRKFVTEVKVIPGEEVALQHQLLVCDMRIDIPPKTKRKFAPRLKIWKLKDPQTSSQFQKTFKEHVSASTNDTDVTTEDIWKNLNTGCSRQLKRYAAQLGPTLRFILIISNYKSVLLQIVLPVVITIVALILQKTSSSSLETLQAPPLQFQTSMYAGPAGGRLQNPLLVFDNSKNKASATTIANLEAAMPVNKFVGRAQNFKSIAPHFIGIQLDSFAGTMLKDFVALYNYSSIHAIPVLINLASQSMLNSSGIFKTLKSTSLPWPDLKKKIKVDGRSFMSCMALSFAFMLMLAEFAVAIVQDREWKLRGQLRISGVTFNLYWGTIYLRDIIVYLIPCTVVLIALFAMDIKGLNSEGAVLSIILMFITNIPFNILMMMIFSFLFDKGETAMSYLPSILQLSGMIPYLVVSMGDMISQSEWAIVMHYVFCAALPPYLIFGGFYFISRVYLNSLSEGREPTISDYLDTDSHILITILAPLVHFLWMYWLLRVLDIRATGGNPEDAFLCLETSFDQGHTINTDVIIGEDEDVAAERLRVEKLTSKDTLVVAFTYQLRKTFVDRNKGSGQPQKKQEKVVVRNLSICVERGEVLGLLGPNGAGKSTTMNMMIAETAPTCGKVVVSGHNMRANALSVLQALGYCPQHDAVWESITLEEHVRLFAAIKGIHSSKLEGVIEDCIGHLKLDEHRKKIAKKLSGGTKRKLSYMMSMLGSSQLVLMDEPSTGMDPQSKRFLWDTINASFKDTPRGAILTTHYMEEADALCDRVGIMVNGTLQCIGATQHLKSKYGSGYILEVKLSLTVNNNVEELMDKLEDHLLNLFPHMDIVERFMERAQYSIPKEDVKSLGKTFSNLEQCKSTHRLEEYSFSQSSLEQVFLYFAKQQLEEGEEGERPERGSVIRGSRDSFSSSFSQPV